MRTDGFFLIQSKYGKPRYGRVQFIYTMFDNLVEVEVVDCWHGTYKWVLFGPVAKKLLEEVAWEDIPEEYQHQILEAMLRE